MAAKKYRYADTTVAYFVLRGGHSLRREHARSVKAGHAWRISPIVRMEYLKGVILTLIEFHSQLMLSDTVDDALSEWSDSFEARRVRVIERHIRAILEGQSMSNDRTIVARRLGEYIRELLDEFDEEFPTSVRNHLHCELAPLTFQQATYSDQLLLDFDKAFTAIFDGTPKCGQCKFKEHWLSELRAAKIDLYSGNQQANFKARKHEGYRRQAALIDEAVQVTDGSPDCKWCVKVADTMIAILCPKSDTLVAGDNSFHALCQLLKKEFHYIPSVPELKRRAAAAAGNPPSSPPK